MVRSLLLFVAPTAVVLAGAWWRRRFVPADRPVAADTPGFGEVAVARVVQSVLRRLDRRATRYFVRLDTAVAETLTIPGDYQALDELLTVLCTHAIETTPCGRVLVTAGHRGDNIAIAVTDDGIGMPTTRTATMLEQSREGLALLGATLETHRHQGIGSTTTVLLPARTDQQPWNATIRNAMTDFARVTEPRKDRARPPAPVRQTEHQLTEESSGSD